MEKKVLLHNERIIVRDESQEPQWHREGHDFISITARNGLYLYVRFDGRQFTVIGHGGEIVLDPPPNHPNILILREP